MFKIRQVYKNKVQPVNVVLPDSKEDDELDVEYVVDDETGEIKEVQKKKETQVVKGVFVEKRPTKPASATTHSIMRRVTEESFM